MKFDHPLQYLVMDSPLGSITVASNGTQIQGIWFNGQTHFPDMQGWMPAERNSLLKIAKTQLTDYFKGKRHQFDLPVDFSAGTAFQQSVWKALLKIPYGKTVSYGWISQKIGKPAAVRAAGAAIGRNPLCILVPCHRVLGSKGELTGYAGGLDRKTGLLQLEQAHQEKSV